MAETLPVFGDEDATSSHILEIIGGIAPKALQKTLAEPCREMDAWSMEEGDDSVFYSDEDTSQQGASLEPRRPVNSEADRIPLEEEEHEEGKVTAYGHQEDLINQEKEKKQTERALEDVNPCCTLSEVILNTEEVVNNSAAQSSSKDHSKITKEPEASSKLSGSYQPPLVVFHKPEKSHSDLQENFQESSEVRSLPALSKKKSSHPKSFNHLTSSKYSTVSYRRIRRGNTKQKIEEFEYMLMNL